MLDSKDEKTDDYSKPKSRIIEKLYNEKGECYSITRVTREGELFLNPQGFLQVRNYKPQPQNDNKI